MFPKRIWVYWNKGWENAPFVVRQCEKSWKHYASDFEITKLDDSNISKYVTLPQEVETIPHLPIQIKANLLRLHLLKKYGGVWIDSTCFLNSNLDSFLEKNKSAFFLFSRAPLAEISNWFIAANKDSYIINTFLAKYEKCIFSKEFLEENSQYFTKWRGSPNYFTFHSLFHKEIRTNPKFKEKMEIMYFSSSKNKLFPARYGYNKDITSDILSYIINNEICFKLSHSLKEDLYNPQSTLAYLIRKMTNEPINHITHVHTNLDIKPYQMPNHFIEQPNYYNYIGSVSSSSDLKVCPEKYSKYHVYNFADPNYNNNSQLLIPYKSNRLFLRHQDGKIFSKTREVAYQDDIEDCKNNMNSNFWLSFILGNIEKIDKRVTLKEVFNKHYIQFVTNVRLSNNR